MAVKPLSWPEARRRLRQVLEAYLDEATSSSSPPSPTTSTTIEIPAATTTTTTSDAPQKVCSLAQWAIDHNLDFYAGSLPLSIALLTLSIIYEFNVAACVLLVFGSIFSLWMFRRSTYLRSHDTDMRKKREVLKFLKSVKAMESEFGIKTGQMDMTLRDMPHLSGTALTDIYPVYRKLNSKSDATNTSSSSFSSSLPAYWTRLPSLLLVQGDFIALQVGDMVPTKCCLVEYPSFHVMAGERLTLESLGEIQADIFAELPRGRTTLPMDSEQLLLLSNKMQIFQVIDTPLDEFIKRSASPSNPSQVWRQMNSVRKALFLLAPIFLIATAVILLVRPSVTSASNTSNSNNNNSSGRDDLSMLIPLPFLATIGLCPVVGPAFVFFLEVLGTARILSTVHPFASSTITTTTASTATTESRNGGGGGDSNERGNNSTARATSDTANGTSNHAKLSPTQLLLSYNLAVVLSRLSLWWIVDASRRVVDRWKEVVLRQHLEEQLPSRRLVRVPPASLNLLEKLGVATACTLVDDELACEPHAIPQQLLIPSGHGLKLLDLCPDYDDDDADHHSDEGTTDSVMARNQGRVYSDNDDVDDSDSDDSEDGATQRFHSTLRRKVLKRRIMRRRRRKKPQKRKNGDVAGGGDPGDNDSSSSEGSADSDFEVQFEDPLWWQHLPSLKCIGLSCLLVDEANSQSDSSASFMDESIRSCRPQHNHAISLPMESDIDVAKRSLVRLVCTEKRSKQLRALAECIGFSTEPNNSGSKGDISPFEECLRLQVLSSQLYRERLSGDAHERSSEQSRWWGFLRPDCTSVIVQDARTGAYQLLTIGDPLVVTMVCNEAWQGESSTILPLAAMDKQTIAETSKNWKLADLDVAAFSYAPVPHTLEARLKEEHLQGTHPTLYLLDHSSPHGQPSLHKDKTISADWALIRNQVFLGVLGALIVPRREIIKLLNTLSEAGVRFVYFSPRNMRRQKELASQMGIDVAWNCAISLRPLGRGEEDPHRMVSGYGDWDINAKLPHGVEAVRHHLEEVDNVPLLVSLYTDATKSRTKEMVEIFQQYSDTVIAVGLSHLPWNAGIFSVADIAVGIDVLTNVGIEKCIPSAGANKDSGNSAGSKMLAFELEFVSAISSHACAFRFRGAASLSHLSDIIEVGRAALAGSTAAAVFLVSSSLSFSFFVLFSVCTPSTTIPFVPTLGAVVYLQIVLPVVGLAMAMTKSKAGTMKQVPPKNDSKITFRRREGYQLYKMVVLKAIPPALLTQLLHLIAFGELMLYFEPELVSSSCGAGDNWVDVIRCDALSDYAGPARTSSGILVFSIFALCSILTSASFVDRFEPIMDQIPWELNPTWALSVVVAVVIVAVFAAIAIDDGIGSVLPWYFYLLSFVIMLFCIIWNEAWKRVECRHERRAEKVRRLQFETRLGAWSPKG